jgi:peptidyl-prolyl cis-trans isomerase C
LTVAQAFRSDWRGLSERLRAAVEEKAMRQYVSLLAGQANIEGVEFDAAVSPLVQ